MELSRHRLAGAAAVLLLAGCVGTPSVSGVPGASPSPEVPWSPPPTAAADLARADSAATPVLPPDLGERIRRLSLAEIVELGLRNNPATRQAWANAQSAAAVYGSERGAWLPSDRRRRERRAAQDHGQPGALRGPAVGAHAERHAVLPAVRFRRTERAGRGGAAAPAVGRVHPQRHHPGRGAPDPDRLLPVSGQPGAARGPSGPRWPRPTPT